MSRRTAGLALLVGLLACRPQPAAPPEPRGTPPLYLATSDRFYTTAPVGDGLSFVPVAEKSIARRPGKVTIAISYPEIDLPDDERERELAALIREAAMLDAWTDERLAGKVGAVEVTCVTPLATTSVVSLVCERIDRTADPADVAGELASSDPELVARTFDLTGAHVVPLTWSNLLLPGVSARLVVAAALEDVAQRDAWLAGQCAVDEPNFSVFVGGVDIWPDRRSRDCPQLTLDRQRIAPFVIPNGTLSRLFRLGGAEPAADLAADPAGESAPAAAAEPADP